MTTLESMLVPSVDNTLKNTRSISENILDYFILNGFSYLNPFIPYYALWANLGVYSKDKEKIIHYSIQDVRNWNYGTGNYVSKQFLQFFLALRNSSVPRRFQTTAMQFSMYVMKGMLFEVIENKPVIHFLLVIDSEYIKEINLQSINHSKMKIYLSYSFVTESRYKSLYDKVKKEVLMDTSLKDIDMVITNDIASKVFVNDIRQPDFKSIDAMNAYFKELKNILVYG